VGAAEAHAGVVETLGGTVEDLARAAQAAGESGDTFASAIENARRGAEQTR
jgi:hypothetical protein